MWPPPTLSLISLPAFSPRFCNPEQELRDFRVPRGKSSRLKAQRIAAPPEGSTNRFRQRTRRLVTPSDVLEVRAHLPPARNFFGSAPPAPRCHFPGQALHGGRFQTGGGRVGGLAGKGWGLDGWGARGARVLETEDTGLPSLSRLAVWGVPRSRSMRSSGRVGRQTTGRTPRMYDAFQLPGGGTAAPPPAGDRRDASGHPARAEIARQVALALQQYVFSPDAPTKAQGPRLIQFPAR